MMWWVVAARLGFLCRRDGNTSVYVVGSFFILDGLCREQVLHSHKSSQKHNCFLLSADMPF